LEHRHKTLIRKYIQGNCTPDELKELQKFMSNPDAQFLFDQVLEESWTGLKAEADIEQPHLNQKLKLFYQQLHIQAEIGSQSRNASKPAYVL
jgi:transmembrane sensor